MTLRTTVTAWTNMLAVEITMSVMNVKLLMTVEIIISYRYRSSNRIDTGIQNNNEHVQCC